MRSPLIIATALLLGHASAKSLGEALVNHGSLSMLHELLEDLDLLVRFNTAKKSTFLAMTDDALVGLANWGLNMSTIDPSLARAILEYHFLEGVYTSSEPSLQTEIQLVHSVLRPPILTNVTAGPVVKLSTGEGGVLCAESGIQKVLYINDSDIHHDNGVVHTIDSNLVLPHNISETTNLGNLHEFWRIIEKSGTRELLEPLQDVTILLPHDNAVKRWRPLLDSLGPEQLAVVIANHAIPNQVLYHTAFAEEGKEFATLGGMKVSVRRDSSGDMFVNEAKVLREDVLIFGGVAHILDGVLVPFTDSSCRSLNSQIWSHLPSRWAHATSWTVAAQDGISAMVVISLAVLAVYKFSNRRSRREHLAPWSTTRWEQYLQSAASEKGRRVRF